MIRSAASTASRSSARLLGASGRRLCASKVPSNNFSSLVALSSCRPAAGLQPPNTFVQQQPCIPDFARTLSTTTATPAATADSADANSIEAQTARYLELIREIKQDLIEADVNKDGKIDSEELKIILRKHKAVFTDHEILELSDLFYMGRAGASVSHEDFMRGIDHIMRGANADDPDKDYELEVANAAPHRRTEKHEHPLGLGNCATEFMYGKERGVYTEDELDVKLTHVEPVTFADKCAHVGVQIIRFCFDAVSLWNVGEITKDKSLRRIIFLESVAAIPGFVAAMVRHFKSVRDFSRDGGMLQMFLDEANNERMHLLSFVRLRDSGTFMRLFVLASQTVVAVPFTIAYNISPAFCHRLVGYIEEEACHTYTTIIDAIENPPPGNDIGDWQTEIAPSIARAYWRLGEEGTVLDMVYAVRADEAEHRDVNHVCSGLKEGQVNPLYNPQEKFDQMLMNYVKQIMEREPKGDAAAAPKSSA